MAAATRGKTVKHSKHVTVKYSATAATIHLTVNGLKPHTAYHLQVVARNSGGQVDSSKKKATTERRKPKHR